MPLIDTATLVRDAHAHGYGIAQINTNGASYELTRAIVEVADETRSPVILGAYEKNLEFRGFEYCGMLMRWFAERATAPVAVHLDHGGSIESCQRAIDAGFTSVMIDGSQLPINENIEQTKQVVALAKPHGVTVEAEVGELQRLGPDGSMPEAKNLSDVDEVRRMSTETGIDMLAVGIGNAHGFYKDTPDIRLDLLEALRDASMAPLVLHGTTGIDDDMVRQCVALGMAKVNLGTLIRTRLVEYTHDVIAEDQHQNHPWRVSAAVIDRIKTHIRHIIEVIGSVDRAAAL